MRNLAPPSVAFDQVLSDLNLQTVASLAPVDLKAMLVSARDSYLHHCRPQTLSQVDHTALPAGVTAYDIHSDVYSTRMVKRAPGKRHYSAFRRRAPHHRCVYCGISTADTLDHVLEKSEWPLQCVTPENLVPACTSCNRRLQAATLANGGQKFHPFFDDLPEERWLYCDLVEVEPLAVSFRLQKPNVSDEVWKRLVATVRATGLLELYATNAARVVSFSARQIARLPDAELRRSHLDDLASDYESEDLNDWEAATARALAESSWFLEDGFRPYVQ